MAKRHGTSRTRSPRNPLETRRSPAHPATASTADLRPSLREAIEEERSRLMTAEAVLHGVANAMDDPDDAYNPDYSILIDLSRDLVRHAIDQLDSVRLKVVLEKTAVHGNEVKEAPAEYAVH